MSQSAGVDLNLNAGQYLQTSTQVISQNTLMDGSFTRLAASSALLNHSLAGESFSKKHSAAIGAFAASAAVAQQNLGGFAATSAITGQSTAKLSKGIDSLARQFPSGTANAMATVSAINELGVSAKGSESKVIALAKTMEQLQGATGGSSVNYAAGMIQLERSFGNRDLNPKKVAATADSLVTVAKRTGASAEGTLAFANNLAPIASSAGLSKEATLGIGAAFTSIGQDGTAASTAISKMMSDMSDAVHNGGPEMTTYANIVGMTATNFKKMFEANPAAAIEKVTQAISKAGTAGPRLLSNLGLDGVRAQKALQALTQSGGLQTAINTSVGASGNGANARASNANFSGVLDKFAEAGTAISQVTVAFGKPLLGPLGILASIFSKVAKVAAEFAGSGLGKLALEVAAGFLVARRIFGLGITGGLVKQAATSGPPMSFLAGRRAGMGQELDENGRLGGRFGKAAGAMEMAANTIYNDPKTGKPEVDAYGKETGRTVLGAGPMGGIRQRLYDAGKGSGDLSAQRAAMQRSGTAGRLNDSYLRAQSDHAALLGSGTATDGQLANSQARVDAAGARLDEVNNPLGPKRNIFSRAASNIKTTASLAGKAYIGVNTAQFAGANTPVLGRMDENGQPIPGSSRSDVMRDRMSPLNGQGAGRVSAAGEAFRSGMATGGISGFTTGIKGATTELRGLGGVAKDGQRSFTRMFSSLAASTGNFGTRAAGTAVAGTASAAGGMLRGAGSLLGGMGPMLAITAVTSLATYAFSRMKASGAAASAEFDRQGSMTATNTLDLYNASIGRASQSTSTFADAMAAHTKLVNTAVTSLSQAIAVSAADKTQAASTAKSTVNYDPSATNSQLSATLRQTAVGGMDPQQIQLVKEDLIRQFGAVRAQQVLSTSGLQNSTAGKSGGQDFAALTAEAAGKTINNSQQVQDAGLGGKANQISASSYYGFGSSMTKASIRKQARDLNDTISQGMGQRFASQQDAYGTGYATQTQAVDINKVAKTAAQSGNEAEFNAITDELAHNNLGIDPKKIPRITTTEVNAAQKKGGSYLTVLASKDKDFAKVLQQWKSEGVDITGRGGLPQSSTLSATAARFSSSALGGGGNAVQAGQFFDNTMTAKDRGQLDNTYVTRTGTDVNRRTSSSILKANQAMLASISSPDDAQKQSDAQHLVVSSTMKTGGSLTKLNEQLGKVASRIDDDTNPAFQRMLGVMAQIRQQASANSQYQSGGQAIGTQLQLDVKDAGMRGNSQGAQNTRAAGVAGATADVAAFNGMVKQQLAAQRAFQISSQRSAADFTLQRKQQQQDYYISTTTGQQDYYIQAVQANQDYQTTVSRAARDFGIQMARGQEDYNVARLRSLRDFNKQIAREVADSASALYDPYKRIQTQATWDTQSLIANMAEQNQAVAKQNAELKMLRKKGLDDAAIEQLKLNDPTNAQQVNQIANDATTNPKLIAQLNKTSAAGIAAGSTLVNDPSNKALARSKADFATTLADQAKDYAKQIARARADQAKSVKDGLADYNKSMARMDASYLLSLARAAANLNLTMDRQALAYSTMTSRAKQDLIESQKEITLSLTQTWAAAQDLVAGKTVDTTGLMHNSLKDLITSNGKLLQTTATQLSQGTLTIGYSATTQAPKAAAPTYGNAAGSSSHRSGASAYGDGAIFGKPGLAYIAERTPEAIIPLNAQGITVLAEAFKRANLTSQQAGVIATSGTAQPLTYVSNTYSYDHSTNFAGANFSVQSNDPNDMAVKLQMKARADRLVSSGKKN